MHQLAQALRKRIDQAAFDAIAADDHFTAPCFGVPVHVRHRHGDGFQRAARKLVTHVRRPVDVEAAVGTLQWRHRNAACLQPGHPGAIRAQLRPAAATQGQHSGLGLQMNLLARVLKAHAAVLVPTQPAVARVHANALATQSVHPGAKQGGGLHFGRKHPPRAAHKGVDAQVVHPGAQGVWWEGVEQGAKLG